jgi:hypothetical protein
VFHVEGYLDTLVYLQSVLGRRINEKPSYSSPEFNGVRARGLRFPVAITNVIINVSG